MFNTSKIIFQLRKIGLIQDYLLQVFLNAVLQSLLGHKLFYFLYDLTNTCVSCMYTVFLSLLILLLSAWQANECHLTPILAR